MPLTVYRGDGRTPDQIRQAGGFQARLQLSPDAARRLVERAVVDPATDVSGLTGNRTSVIVQYLQEHPGLVGMRALANAIKKEREANSIHISTELGLGGGGMGGAYLYRIDCPTPLFQWAPDGRNGIAGPPAPLQSNADLGTSLVKSYLITDTDVGGDPAASVAAASLLAAYTYTSTLAEVAFLTAIPYGWISEYRPASGGAWAPMP